MNFFLIFEFLVGSIGNYYYSPYYDSWLFTFADSDKALQIIREILPSLHYNFNESLDCRPLILQPILINAIIVLFWCIDQRYGIATTASYTYRRIMQKSDNFIWKIQIILKFLDVSSHYHYIFIKICFSQ